jgi:hypothetical protein
LAFVYFVASGQATIDGVYAKLGSYTSPDCAGGTLDGSEELPRTGNWNVEDSWQTVDVVVEPSPVAQSILVELGVRDTDLADEAPPVSADFDEILFRAE